MDCIDVQVDLSLHLLHLSFCKVCFAPAHIILSGQLLYIVIMLLISNFILSQLQVQGLLY